ncbi:MAG: hypothetical protein ABIH00_00165 [Armatimonadota bacterium]
MNINPINPFDKTSFYGKSKNTREKIIEAREEAAKAAAAAIMEAEAKKKEKMETDFVFQARFDSEIPPQAQKVVREFIKVSIMSILSGIPEDMENPLSFSGKKIIPEDNTVTLIVGDLKKNIKKETGADTDKMEAYSSIKLDGMTVAMKILNPAKKTRIKKLAIFLDGNELLKKGSGFEPWLVALNHEICGHFRQHLDDTVPADGNKEEYIAYKTSNKVLSNIIENFKKINAPQRIIKNLEILLEKDKKTETLYRKKAGL